MWIIISIVAIMSIIIIPPSIVLTKKTNINKSTTTKSSIAEIITTPKEPTTSSATATTTTTKTTNTTANPSLSFNQPMFSATPLWNSNGITIANQSIVGRVPMAIFVSTDNTIYVANEDNKTIVIWHEESGNPTKIIH
ncbi:unnamed protein product, partial [Adineta steineri]